MINENVNGNVNSYSRMGTSEAMTDNVIHLPRPREQRGTSDGLAFYVRVGRNDHRELLEILAGGEHGFFGLVIDATNANRHRELIAEARRRNFDVALDPKTQAMGTVGGYTQSHQSVPWGLDRPHRTDDFDGAEGQYRAEQIAAFAVEHGFTQILGPTHLLQSANDPWLRRDINMMREVRRALDAQRSPVQLIHSLALPMQVMRDVQQRRAIIAAVSDAPMDALWLKVENFGADATGDKTAAYVAACRDFHGLGVPLVADHVGGLPGLGLLAFGAVGGIAHGITLLEGFKADRWRRLPIEGRKGGAPETQIYLPALDLLLKRNEFEAFLNRSQRVRSLCGCRDTHCCPHGVRDMLGHPARHFLHQRGREVEALGSIPASLRAGQYLEQVRRVSDNVAIAAGLGKTAGDLLEKLVKKQRAAGRFRSAMAHLAESGPAETISATPERRSAHDGR